MASSSAAAAAAKTAEELRREIDELHRQQREITERLRDPRGLRRAGGPRAASGLRQRGVVRPAVDSEDQPAPKRRILSAVVRVEGGEVKEEAGKATDASKVEEQLDDAVMSTENGDVRTAGRQGGYRRDPDSRFMRMKINDEPPEPLPREIRKEDPSLVKRNRRMLGQLLGTLEKFREEDKQLSSTDAYTRRLQTLQKAEEKAREESERLRQQEREQIAEKRRRDLTLRARIAAKAEEKKLELLFIQWTEHHKKLGNFIRTKAQPPIYYMPTKPLIGDPALLEQRKEQEFEHWKTERRAELTEYQKQVGEKYLANVEVELERWQKARNARRANNLVDLQETMDKELETHRLEHGPKTRRVTGNNDDEEVEDIAAEDELMDEVLEVQDRNEGEENKQQEGGVARSPSPSEMQ